MLGVGNRATSPRSVAHLPGVGESNAIRPMCLLRSMSNDMSVLRSEVLELKQQQLQTSAVVSEMSRATTQEPVLAQPAVQRAVQSDSGQGERSAGVLRQTWCDPVAESLEPSDDESWSTPCASPTRRHRSRSRSRGTVRRSRHRRSPSRSTVAARGPVDDGPSRSDDAGCPDAGRRRGRSSAQLNSTQLNSTT